MLNIDAWMQTQSKVTAFIYVSATYHNNGWNEVRQVRQRAQWRLLDQRRLQDSQHRHLVVRAFKLTVVAIATRQELHLDTKHRSEGDRHDDTEEELGVAWYQ